MYFCLAVRINIVRVWIYRDFNVGIIIVFI